MNTKTIINFAKIKPEGLCLQRDEVITQREATRKASNNAIAHCTMLGLCCLGNAAVSGSQAWLSAQIDAYNGEIKRHNANVEAAKLRAVKFAQTGELSPDDALAIRHNDPDSQAQQSEEKEALRQEGRQDDKYWAAQKRCPAESNRNGANTYTGLVRFAYGYDKADDASAVSELARVVEYLVTDFAQKTSASVADIVRRIDELGGKSKILKLARGNPADDDSKPSSSEDEAAMLAAYRQKLVAAAKNMSAKSVAEGTLSNEAPGDLVLVLGRQGDTNTALLTSLSLDNTLLQKFAAPLNKVIPVALDPQADFLAGFLAFLPMIPTGKLSTVTLNGTRSGQKAKERRVLVVHLDQNGKLTFELTAQYASSTPLVKATLKETVNFAFSGPAQIIAADDLQCIVAQLNDDIVRYLVTGSSNTENNMFTLVVENPLIKDKNGISDIKQAAFSPLKNENTKPITVNPNKVDYTATLTHADLQAFYNAELVGWQDKTRGGTAELTFTVSGIVYNYDGKTAYTIRATGTTASANTLHFRGLDLYHAFHNLLRLNCRTYTLKMDIDGLLVVMCEDNFATYELALPAAADNVLSTAGFTRLRAA